MSTTLIYGPVAVHDKTTDVIFYVDNPGKACLLGLNMCEPERIFIFDPKAPANGVLEYWPNKDKADWPHPSYKFSSHEVFSLLEQGLDIMLADESGKTLVELSLPRPEVWVYTITLVHPSVDLPYEIIDGEHLALVRVTKWTWIVTTKADLSKALENYQYWRRPLL